MSLPHHCSKAKARKCRKLRQGRSTLAARSHALDLELKRLRAEATQQARSAFLSRMSHELRTPLNAIMGFTQLLKLDTSQPLSEGQEKRVNAVLLAGEELLQLIERLLGLSSEEASLPAVQAERGWLML
jgi:signal transduction histidine kinase